MGSIKDLKKEEKKMPDDLTKKGKSDREQVNHGEDWETDYQEQKKNKKLPNQGESNK